MCEVPCRDADCGPASALRLPASAETWSPSPSRRRGSCGRSSRVTGVEVPYPFVAALAFTPYAALLAPLPVLAALLLRRWVVAGVAAVAAVALGLALLPRTVGGPEAGCAGAAADGHDVEPAARARRRAGAAAGRARARRRRAQRPGAAAGADAPAGPGRARASCSPAGWSTRGSAPSGSGVLSRTPLRAVDTSPDRTGHAQPEVELEVAGAPPVRIKAVHPAPPVNRAVAPALAQRARARCPAATAAATCRSSPATSTPRSTTPSCAT